MAARTASPALAADCETLELHGSALTVTTPNPALAHQLRLDAERLKLVERERAKTATAS